MSTGFGIPSPAIAATKLPLYDQSDAAIYLRAFLLNCQDAVKANQIRRHQMLKAALHAHVQAAFGEAIGSLIDIATDQLHERLCACPEDELEADEPDGNLPLDLPGPSND